MDETAEAAAQLGYSAYGRLTVKIKLPKPEAAAAAEQVKRHVCAECNKAFSSGKALGGHMSSAHVQANKDLKSMKMAKQNRSDSGSENEFSCALCGKDFPSKKSLFGHMRCHPEREWRGMAPPAPPENSSELETNDAELFEEGEIYDETEPGRGPALDLSLSLRGWSVTAKRGRRSAKSPTASPPPPPRVLSDMEDQELYDAVHQLISLVNDVGSGKRKLEGDEGMSSNSVTPQQPEFPNPSSRFKKLKIRDDKNNNNNDDDSCVFDNDKNTGGCVGGEPKEVLSEEDSSSDNDGNELNSRQRFLKPRVRGIKKKGDRISKIVEPIPQQQEEEEEDNDSSPDKFICTTCKRRFSTHQALGGHRSSHNKLKISIYNTKDDQTIDTNPKEREDDNKKLRGLVRAKATLNQDQESRMGDEDGLNFCKICNKTFANVEALRIHKKNHRNGLLEPGSSSRVTSFTHENTKTETKGFGFDLNELPNGDDENGVQQ